MNIRTVYCVRIKKHTVKGINLLRFFVLAVSIAISSIAAVIEAKAGEKKYTICPSSKFVIAEIDGTKFDVPQIVLDNGASIDHDSWRLRDEGSFWSPVPEKCNEYSDVIPVVEAKTIVITRFHPDAARKLKLPLLAGNIFFIGGQNSSMCRLRRPGNQGLLARLGKTPDSSARANLLPGVLQIADRELIISLAGAGLNAQDRAIAQCSHDILNGFATNGMCAYAVRLKSGHCLMHRFTFTQKNSDGSVMKSLPFRLGQQLKFVREVMRCSNC